MRDRDGRRDLSVSFILELFSFIFVRPCVLSELSFYRAFMVDPDGVVVPHKHM